MSTQVHGTTCAQAREPGRRDNGLANDVRDSPANVVRDSPTDEGAGVASRGDGVTRGTTTKDCSQRISSVVTPNSRKSAIFQTKPRSPCTERALRKSGTQQTSFLAHLGSVLIQNQCAVRCQRTSPEETTLHMPVKKISEDDSV